MLKVTAILVYKEMTIHVSCWLSPSIIGTSHSKCIISLCSCNWFYCKNGHYLMYNLSTENTCHLPAIHYCIFLLFIILYVTSFISRPGGLLVSLTYGILTVLPQ